MMFNYIFRVLVALVTALDQGLIPTLPSSFRSIWDTMLQYIGTGFRFIQVTFDVTLLRQLISWWIAFGALVLAIEIFYGIWKKITGNAGREAVSVTTTFDSEGSRVTRVTRSNSHNSLPRL